MFASGALPDQSAAAGVLITDESGRTLLLRTHNRTELVLPGGVVEQGESPASAAERELVEEVGLTWNVSRLLVVQHKPPMGGSPGSLMFVFDSDPLHHSANLTLQPEEVAEAFWLDASQAVRRHTEGGRDRLAMAFRARAEDRTIYMDADRVLSH